MRAVGFVSGVTQYGVISFMCPSAYVNVRIVSASIFTCRYRVKLFTSCASPFWWWTHTLILHPLDRQTKPLWPGLLEESIQPGYKGLKRLTTTIVHLYLCSSVLHFPSVCTYIHIFVYLDLRVPLCNASLVSFCHGKLFTAISTRQMLEDARLREMNAIRTKSGT